MKQSEKKGLNINCNTEYMAVKIRAKDANYTLEITKEK